MAKFVAASLFVGVEAATLAVTWSDCGAKHAKVTSVSPDTVETGKTQTVTGTGTVDEDVTAVSFETTLSAAGVKLASCSGDGKTDMKCNLPLGTGNIVLPALSFPIKAGTMDIPMKVTTSALIPPSLAKVDVHVTATDQQSETLVCLDVHTAKAVSWEEFKAEFGKTYNGDEDAKRQAIFEGNMAEWAEYNKDPANTAILGATQFADLTPDEFKALPLFGLKQPEKTIPSLGIHEYQGEELAASVDWRSKGAVTPVKNQGQCGSCWAFSTVGGLEGAWQIGTGTLTSMSEQQFVDCSKQNSGCNGGLMDSAFAYAEGVAVATESSYPYSARDGSCKSSYSTAIPRGGVVGYKDVSNSASSLKSALNNGPVSVAIEADQSVFQGYTGGVISSGCGSSLDHGVTAVGYTSSYFIVKNSWGTSWGLGGYVNIAGTQCGITSSASYPQVSGSVSV